jgi:hypothetical protein
MNQFKLSQYEILIARIKIDKNIDTDKEELI